MSDDDEIGRWHAGHWAIHGDSPGNVYLQVELGNGRAVTLTCSSDGARTTLWTYSGEMVFQAIPGEAEGQTAETFRQWLADAVVGDEDDGDEQ
jgi:hypothetical protein